MANLPAFNGLHRAPRRARRDAHGVGLFVVEKKGEDGRWSASSTRRTARGAQDSAWRLLAREGGEVRVRHGRLVVAEGVAREAPRAAYGPRAAR